ncbi:MAG TPA: DUF4157 domain-containing protein [Longimicrobiaceae bacterium]
MPPRHREPGPGAPERAGGAAEPVLRMQRVLGNATVQRMLAARAAVPGGASPLEPGTEEEIRAARGGGQALDAGTRGNMEAALGTDFSGVRVHTGARADTLSRALSARAFTTGRDVFFRAGEYRPGTSSGDALLAHELTHVVQQGGTAAPVQRALEVGPADDAYEREADRVAHAVARGEAGRGHGAAAPGGRVQRQADGSGEHGTWGAWAGDYVNKQLWYRVADAAELFGLPNAARHMRHYLNNSGSTLTVSADAMLRDLSVLRERFDTETASARAEADARVAADPTPRTFTLTGTRRNAYAGKSQSSDWYYAIGGFTYWYTADVTVAPPASPGAGPTVTMRIRLHVFDRYNWDQGKSVNILGFIHVSDESLGRLHRVGLAREYEVSGVSSETSTTWVHTGASAGPAAPAAGSREGERTDPGRDRSSDRRQDREWRSGPR